MDCNQVSLIDCIFFYGFFAFGALAWDKFCEEINPHLNYLRRSYTVFYTFIVLPLILWFLLPTNLSYGLPFYILVRYGSYFVILLETLLLSYSTYEELRGLSRSDIVVIFSIATILMHAMYGLSTHFAYHYLVYLAYNFQICHRKVRQYIRAIRVEKGDHLIFMAVYFSTILVLFAYMGDPYLRPLGVPIDL